MNGEEANDGRPREDRRERRRSRSRERHRSKSRKESDVLVLDRPVIEKEVVLVGTRRVPIEDTESHTNTGM
jgi:hypothetical protein